MYLAAALVRAVSSRWLNWPAGQVDVDVGAHRDVKRERADGVGQTPVGEYRRADAAHQVTQFVEHLIEVALASATSLA
jgi:hypothetical protein